MRGLVLFFCFALVAFAVQLATGQTEDPSGAVFLIHTTDRDAHDGKVKPYGYGTAFFISKDGTALTVGHVVRRVHKEPEKYRLIAIVAKEFYDVQLVCAVVPQVTPDGMGHILESPGRDIAEIKLIPSTAYEGKKDTFFYFPKSGAPIPLATAHQTSLPQFPFLTIGGRASGNVRIIGFGAISAIPHVWTAHERVEDTFSARDGTPFFGHYSDNPSTYGNSGSPVLDDQNQVVGIETMTHPAHYGDRRYGASQGSSVLLNPCK